MASLSQALSVSASPSRRTPVPEGASLHSRILAMVEGWAQRHHEASSRRLEDELASHSRVVQVIRVPFTACTLEEIAPPREGVSKVLPPACVGTRVC